MTLPATNTLLTSRDAYLRHDLSTKRWQLGTNQTELSLSVQTEGRLSLDSWRHLPSDTAWVAQPHTPLRIEIDGRDETGKLHYERFAHGTDPDDSLFLDIWLRHHTRGLLVHLFLIVYPGSSFIATFVRIQNGTADEVRLTRLSSLHLYLNSTKAQAQLVRLLLQGDQLLRDSKKYNVPTNVYFQSALFLLQPDSNKGLLGTLETERDWQMQLAQRHGQIVLDAHVPFREEGDPFILPAQRGRIDSVQACIGHVAPESAEAELREFLGKYR
jgi:hypothetical protein